MVSKCTTFSPVCVEARSRGGRLLVCPVGTTDARLRLLASITLTSGRHATAVRPFAIRASRGPVCAH
eukprot:6918616-Prymnesium_polylepis.1